MDAQGRAATGLRFAACHILKSACTCTAGCGLGKGNKLESFVSATLTAVFL